MRLGLLGRDIQYTRSPELFSIMSDVMQAVTTYEIVDTPGIQPVIDRLRGDFNGFNVTQPYKSDIIDYIDDLRTDAGAVNVVTNTMGFFTGYNTDTYGVRKAFEHFGYSFSGKSVLIMGAGGSAKAVIRAVTGGSAPCSRVMMYNRTEERITQIGAELNIDITPVKSLDISAQIVINCIPYYKETADIIPNLDDTEFLLDLNYRQSQIYLFAKQRGIPCADGEVMLCYQGIKGFEIFLDSKISQESRAAVLRRFLRDDSISAFRSDLIED